MPLPAAIIPAIIGAGSSLVGGFINNAFSEARANRQFQQSLYLQDKQNEYNTPIAQMYRLKEAGLNPNLIYSTNPNMPSATASPAQQPQSSPIDTQGVLQMVSLVVNAMLEKDKLETQKTIASANNATAVKTTEIQTRSNEAISSAQITSSESENAKNRTHQLDLQKKTFDHDSEERKKDREQRKKEFEANQKQVAKFETLKLAIQERLAQANIKATNARTSYQEIQNKLLDKTFFSELESRQLQNLSNIINSKNMIVRGILDAERVISFDELNRVYTDLGIFVPSEDIFNAVDYHNDMLYLYRDVSQRELKNRGETITWRHFIGATNDVLNLYNKVK